MSYPEKAKEIPRIEGKANEQGVPSPQFIKEFARLSRMLTNFELPIFQAHVTPGEHLGYPAPLSTLGQFVLRTCLEEAANEKYQAINGGTRREFAFTFLSPIRPYANRLTSDRLVPIESRTGGQMSPHTDSGFTGPSLHLQRRATPFGQPTPTRTVWAAFAKPSHDVGWDPSTHQLPEITQNYYREQSIRNILRHNRMGFSDPDIAKHIDGPIFRGTTEPGVMTIMIDGNMAPPWQEPTSSTLHYFEDAPGSTAPPWVRYTMLYNDYYGRNNDLLPLLRENLLQTVTFEASTAEYMDLREQLKTPTVPNIDPYFWFSEQINDIKDASNLTLALSAFKRNFTQTHGGSSHDAELMAHKIQHYLLSPGHDLIYAPSPNRDPHTPPVYVSWPGDTRGRKPIPHHTQEPLFPLFGDQYKDPQFQMSERPPAPEFSPKGPALNKDFKQ